MNAAASVSAARASGTQPSNSGQTWGTASHWSSRTEPPARRSHAAMRSVSSRRISVSPNSISTGGGSAKGACKVAAFSKVEGEGVEGVQGLAQALAHGVALGVVDVGIKAHVHARPVGALAHAVNRSRASR